MKLLQSFLLAALSLCTTILSQSTTTSSSPSSSASASASPLSTACNSGLCTSINLPSSGNDIYLQIRGPTSAGWIGSGIGSGMTGALIFVLYPSSTGSNITVSPRLGRGHIEPEYDSSITLDVLAGTEISADGDTMIANFRCTNCRSWSGGDLDASSSQERFIWALGPGEEVRDDGPEAEISQHASKGVFALDLVQATGGEGGNPFASSAGAEEPGETAPGDSSVSAPQTKADRILIAHGAIMATTFVALFPLGAAFIRLLNDKLPNALMFHRVLQSFNAIMVILGLSMAIWYIDEENDQNFNSFHEVFGLIVIILIFIQGALGAIHHANFKKYQRRTVWSYIHIWLGRFVILAGIVNGGIGLGPSLGNASTGQKAAYSVVAALVVLTYVGFYWLKSRKIVLSKRG